MGMASPPIDARIAAALLAGAIPELRLSCLWTLTSTGSGFEGLGCCANALGPRLDMATRAAAHQRNVPELFMDEILSTQPISGAEYSTSSVPSQQKTPLNSVKLCL